MIDVRLVGDLDLVSSQNVHGLVVLSFITFWEQGARQNLNAEL